MTRTIAELEAEARRLMDKCDREERGCPDAIAMSILEYRDLLSDGRHLISGFKPIDTIRLCGVPIVVDRP